MLLSILGNGERWCGNHLRIGEQSNAEAHLSRMVKQGSVSNTRPTVPCMLDAAPSFTLSEGMIPTSPSLTLIEVALFVLLAENRYCKKTSPNG